MKKEDFKTYAALSFGTVIMGTLLFLYTVTGANADYKRTTTVTTTTTTYSDTDTPFPPPEANHTYIKFDIKMKKDYEPNQRVDGDIVIDNSYSESLPATFYVKLYHNDKFNESYVVKVPGLFPGQTTFSLDEFGIPTINRSAADQGKWTIVISQGGEDPALSKEASFRILSSV